MVMNAILGVVIMGLIWESLTPEEKGLTNEPQVSAREFEALDRRHSQRELGPRSLWFAQDSPLEETVWSEPVSESPNSLLAGENTGNFVRRGLRVRLLARNPASNSMVCEPIPYASEQGIYFGLAGN